MSSGLSKKVLVALALSFLVPVLHPVFRPALGPPSHLLWWIHVLPVAFLTFHHGRAGAGTTVGVSTALVVFGERSFGAGYGVPATWETTLSLSIALALTNLLVAAFALYARTATGRYQLLFDRLTLAVLRTDESGRIQDANPAAAELFETDPDTLRQRSFQDLVESPDAGWDVDADVLADESWSGRLVIKSPALEEPRSIHAFVLSIYHPDTGDRQIVLADRTMEVLQDQEIRRKAKLASLGEALAGVAHELKNPLTAIMGHVQLGLAPETSREDLREVCRVVLDQSERMKGLVDELLGFSRSDSRATVTRMDDLVDSLLRVQEVSQPPEVTLDSDIRGVGWVRANPTKVEQILMNLVSNATDAILEGGGSRVTVASRPSLVPEAVGRGAHSGDDGTGGGSRVERGDGSEAMVEVEVRDDGPGIPRGLLPELFAPFVTTKQRGEGTGLGLAISRRLARSMGGTLEARNRPEGGASFILRLPAARPSEVQSGSNQGAPPDPEAERGPEPETPTARPVSPAPAG